MQRKKFVKAADHAPPAAGSYVKVLPGIEWLACVGSVVAKSNNTNMVLYHNLFLNLVN